MACKEDATFAALRNITQCSICIDTFKDPRLLPCAHTFCMKCLEETQPKTKTKCALCRKPFDIPIGGLSKLPKNAMIEELIDLSKEPNSFENSETPQEQKMTLQKAVNPEPPSDNIESASANLSAQALHCGNCNNCEQCSRAQDVRNNEEVQENVALDDQMKEQSTQTAEIPKPEDTESLCDVCVLNNSDGNQKVSTAALYCMDCEENQCEKCSAEHMRQRLCKQHTVVSLEDHLKEKLLQKEEPKETLDTTILCDICLDNNESGTAAIATLHCIDCTENQCDDCSREHKRQRLCKDHKIVVLDEQMKDKLIKMREVARSTSEDIYCDICVENSENGNAKIPATWHCVDCNENQCGDCSREHKRQRLCKNHQIVVIDDQMKETLAKAKQTANSSEVHVFCDICKENNEIGKEDVAATLHCTECEENQCKDCSKEHKKQRLFKNHQIIVLDAQMKDKLLRVKENDKKPDLEIVCDICAENSECGETWSAATLHCKECDENHCNNCSKEHKKQRLFRSHEVIPIDDHMKSNNIISKMKAEADILCDMCAGYTYSSSQTADTRKATLYCIACQENQCEECNRTHLKQKQFRDHQVVALNVQLQQKETHPRSCSVHMKEQLKFFCFTCQTVICMKCIDKEHNSHEYQFACSVADGFLNDIKSYLEIVDSWLQQGDITKHELQLKCLETEIVRKASTISGHNTNPEVACPLKEYQLNTRMELKNELDEHLANLSAFKGMCNALQTQKSSVNICLIINELRVKFEELRRQQELYSPERLYSRGASNPADCMPSDPASPYYGFRQQMKKVVDKRLTNMLRDESYSKIRNMIERPHMDEDEINQFWHRAFPYTIQRIKMWNGYVVTAQNIADLVVRKQKQKELVTDSQTLNTNRKPNQETKASEISVYPVSRLDCLTYIVNIADCIVAHDILRIMSKFPVSIPLIVQDIHEDNKFIVTVPIIQNTVIKWESNPGQIAENHLFTSRFRMVAAVRLGTHKIGKSTILNQLMSRPFLFSSKGEAGSRYGRPCTLDGAVEIVWLTQETCSSPTWKTTMSEYYKGNTEEVAILANFHGRPLRHPDTLTYLEKLVCSFIVFLMPDFSETELAQLMQRIKSKHVIQVLVDPQENVNKENCMNVIQTDSLSSDDTLHTMRCLLKESFRLDTKTASTSMEKIFHTCESLRYAEPLHCKQSTEIVETVGDHGCSNIKQLLIDADITEHTKWSYTLKRLIKLSLDILSHPTKDAKKYLTHLETSLSQISANESMAARTEVSKANDKLRRILRVPNKTTNSGNSEDGQIEADLKKAQEELEAAMTKVDIINLGQEHFFRTLGQLYETSLRISDLGDFRAICDLPNNFADLLINGHAIEMLNGDSGKIQLIWIKAICDSVLKKCPNLKVFVISIIGLQSSGKSTLLNALFSCRFAVSVGRCSRGLFMRMIFLDEKLRNSLGCHAIILIDTEGLSSPEKMNDPKANQKDRLMATYAMGISDLTIVNILGEGMTEMTEILQIAIVAMARLRGGGIKPDILMVQHLQERNLSKIDQAKGQFCEAINKAFELISKNDVEIGSASAECLAELTDRIHSGDLFQHFGPFKDGSSVNSPPSESYHDSVVSLLETILKRTRVSEKKSSFERWCTHFESYWTCVQEESFALNFKNIMHITDFLYFEKKIAKVKELLDRAIRHHREIFSKKIREHISIQISEKRKTRADSMQRQRNIEEIEQQMQLIPHACPSNCVTCRQSNDSHAILLEELSNSEWKEGALLSLERCNRRLHEITMRMLTQAFDGSLVRQGCFFDFSVRIATELKAALVQRPNGLYSIAEQKNISEAIWRDLQNIAAEMEAGPNLEEKLNQTLYQEYSAVWPTILKDLKIEISKEYLAKLSATSSFLSKIGFVSNKLTDDQMSNLLNTINQLVDTVFGCRCADFNKTGLDFEEGMIGDIKAAFPDAIKRFEDRFRIKLHDMFKFNLLAYAFQQFRKKMMDQQKRWDSQNKPSEILKQKKQDYMTEIETRLKSGFSSAGEGQVVATKLYNAMKKKAIQAGFDEKVQFIKDMSWTTNSEKVRLCYFEELAKEVQAGRKMRAFMHFTNPKDEIQKWYKQRIDSFDVKDRVMEVYKSTLKTELSRLVQKIINSTTEDEISKIVEEHVKAGDDRYYSKLDPKDCDFDAFKDNIEEKLKHVCELDNMEDIVFPLASDDSDIMGRLGCTEHCFWCGALCWGSRDHQLEKDKFSEIEAHHSCHQPSGLRGVANKRTKRLISTACHNDQDNARVWFREFQDDDGMLWSEAKQNHFKDWKFDIHCITKFDELMRWFFQELHQEIAKNRGSLPADETELKENKCKYLKLREILKVVRNKI